MVPISASKNEGIDELIEHAMHVVRYDVRPRRMDFCDDGGDADGAVHRCIHAVVHLIDDHARRCQDARALCRDQGSSRATSLILEQLKLDANEVEMLEHIVKQMEEESGHRSRWRRWRICAIASSSALCAQTVVQPAREPRTARAAAKSTAMLTGQIHRDSRVYRHHGAGVLADVRCDRRIPLLTCCRWASTR